MSRLLEKRDRVMVGVMSGTSVDAVDVAFVRVSGTGTSIKVESLGSRSESVPADLRRTIEANMLPETSNVRDLALLNVRIAHLYADAIRSAAGALGLGLPDVDAVGSHGQTMYHEPRPTWMAGLDISASFQLGDPSTLANLLRLPVVGDFRMADMALGGQGAPLVPYFDYVCFRSEEEGRLLLNLGGIANVTALPANCLPDEVIAFDTGPANRVLDSLASHLLDAAYDADGQMALAGTVNDALLRELLSHPWFATPPPKSTGRELFSEDYVRRLIGRSGELGVPTEDLFATAAALTSASVADAWRRFVAPVAQVDRVIVSGGGVYNRAVMAGLVQAFGGVPVESSARFGVNPDAKEAICFAVLAHETLNGIPSNVPSATGASGSTILGKICVPHRGSHNELDT